MQNKFRRADPDYEKRKIHKQLKLEAFSFGKTIMDLGIYVNFVGHDRVQFRPRQPVGR